MGDQEKRAAVANQVKMLPPLEMTRDENIRKKQKRRSYEFMSHQKCFERQGTHEGILH